MNESRGPATEAGRVFVAAGATPGDKAERKRIALAIEIEARADFRNEIERLALIVLDAEREIKRLRAALTGLREFIMPQVLKAKRDKAPGRTEFWCGLRNRIDEALEPSDGRRPPRRAALKGGPE